MQFLRASTLRHRRRRWEHLILLLLRMGLIVLLVLALASPHADYSWLPQPANHDPREVLLLIDNSTSMGLNDGKNPTPAEEARAWVESWIQQLGPDDRVAIALAKTPLSPLPWTADPNQLMNQLAAFPPPAGNSDWPGAVEGGARWLKSQPRIRRREIILLKDRQRFGWADAATLSQWEGLAPSVQSPSSFKNVVVEVGPTNPQLPNFSLGPLRPVRNLPVRGQTVRFTCPLILNHFQNRPRPPEVRLEINGKWSGVAALPANLELREGQIPLTFAHRFDQAGSYLISVILDPESTPDALPGDNRQNLALEVFNDFPVLIIEGDERLSSQGAGFYLHQALKSMLKNSPGMEVPLIPARDWQPSPKAAPRLLILADVPRLTPRQELAVEHLLASGGSVLVLLGERVLQSRQYYNEQLYRDGQGWLPGRLGEVAESNQPPRLDVAKSRLKFLEIFKGEDSRTLAKVPLPRWWNISPGPRASPVAWLTNGAPWLVEQNIQGGRVMLCATTLDRTWKSPLPTLPEFPIMIHEMVDYLLDRDIASYNLAPGQPFQLPDHKMNEWTPTCTFIRPSGKETPLLWDRKPFLTPPDEGAGAYRLRNPAGDLLYFVTKFDTGESNLQSCSDEDRAAVAQRTGLQYQESAPTSSPDAGEPQDLWWLFFLGVVVLLFGEIWLTRRQIVAGPQKNPSDHYP